MDIAALSVGMNQGSLQQNANIAVMKMAMDAGKVNAVGLIDMMSQTKNMEMSVRPNLGGNIDIKC